MTKEKNRKLSAKEQRRLNVFEKTCERLTQDESKKVLIYDHPTQAGLVIFEK